MSLHEIPVVRIGNIKQHPNADKLEIVEVFGYTACIGKGQFKTGDLAIYIPPDYEVPVNRSEFEFLKERAKGKEYYRIRVVKMRGIISQGLLIQAPFYAIEGVNLINFYNIKRYEPPIKGLGTGGDNVKAPEGYFPVYDVESALRYNTVLKEGEEVVITEKIHGVSSRYVYRNGNMFCGSHRNWKKEDPQNLWWKALANHPEIREFCESHQDITVYGEVYGPVQKLRYGLREPKIAVFDLLKENKWINSLDARELGAKLPWVPLLYQGPYKFVTAIQLAEQDSSIESAPKGHIREGVVVKPIIERFDPEIGRVNLKIVSNRYLGNE
jgi:RNA ligase (TIGR02306 family)